MRFQNLETLVEQVYGHLKTAGLVLLFAVGPNALEFAFSTGGVGLSGVGYGLFGLLWVLCKRDERFRDAIDQGTIQLFVVWFFICIATTVTNIMPVGNIAHGVGCALGILTGCAITLPEHRTRIAVSITAVLAFGLWAATLGRPLVNMSGTAGYKEGKWGYDALMANHNQEAVRWLRDAARYQPKENAYWYNLGIAYERLGNQPAATAAFARAANQNDAHGVLSRRDV
ncbi:MAG TPA: rhomboid family intramembrane serine protease [Candidatus Angelobacter sp.]|nr:rhomboid family intramembrane serine protease [Candidatus Angelobacter sp.]